MNLVQKHFLERGTGPEFDMEASYVRDHLPAHATRVADIGCGIGGLFGVIGHERTIGFDYLLPGLRHTKLAHHSVPLCCADAGRIPLMDRSLDAITAQHVIEHLPDPLAVCLEWRRVLRPGGCILILTPNRDYADPTIYNSDPTHLQIFSHDELTDLVELAGFEVLQMSSLGLPWCRKHLHLPAVWRVRNAMLGAAAALAKWPTFRWQGQTLCCVARKLA